ncbi:MAG: GDP-mannose 4,6-dehydratase [Anaerolineae bacterium]|nr:GDP-mannose 4,6-dehydratase [Anaerolineae bacterium]MDW8173798.1 GDP-mannose 4,6-dehydratase [Anaerolineae bacterium]
MAKVLITGGAGFIGSHLSELLLSQGHHVAIIDNLSTGRFANIEGLVKHPRFHFAIEDIRQFNILDRMMSECDVVIHLAAVVGVEKIIREPINTIEINIGGTEMVLQAARRYRKRTLIASTSEVYGKGVSFPFREDDDSLLGPTSKSRWSYAASKAIDEFLALAYHQEAQLPVTIFRLFNTVGPRQQGQYGMVLPRFVQWAIRHEPIQVYGDGQQSRCFCNVSDVVQAIVGLMDCPDSIGQVVNVGSDEEITMLDLAERVRERADSASEIRLVPYEEAYAVPGFEDFRRRVPSIERIRGLTGWQPSTPLNTTIDQIIAYYREVQKHG